MLEAIVASLLAFGGAVAYIQKIEGRVTTNEKLTDEKFEALEKLINAKFDSSNRLLERIERAVNNGKPS